MHTFLISGSLKQPEVALNDDIGADWRQQFIHPNEFCDGIYCCDGEVGDCSGLVVGGEVLWIDQTDPVKDEPFEIYEILMRHWLWYRLWGVYLFKSAPNDRSYKPIQPATTCPDFLNKMS